VCHTILVPATGWGETLSGKLGNACFETASDRYRHRHVAVQYIAIHSRAWYIVICAEHRAHISVGRSLHPVGSNRPPVLILYALWECGGIGQDG
jgi:hypothetical protein